MRQNDMFYRHLGECKSFREFLSSCCCLVVLSNVIASTTSRTFSLYFNLAFEQIDLYTVVHASYNPRRIRLLSKVRFRIMMNSSRVCGKLEDDGRSPNDRRLASREKHALKRAATGKIINALNYGSNLSLHTTRSGILRTFAHKLHEFQISTPVLFAMEMATCPFFCPGRQ
jgi:hypothetical protein